MTRRSNHNRRPRLRTHNHRPGSGGWRFTPVLVDPRVKAGAAPGCVLRFPDEFVEHVLAASVVPPPEHFFVINANRGPRNENGDDAPFGPLICVDCCVDAWPHAAEAFRIATRGLIAVSDGADGWTERTWGYFKGPDGRYRGEETN